jgi:hypothetical protein
MSYKTFLKGGPPCIRKTFRLGQPTTEPCPQVQGSKHSAAPERQVRGRRTMCTATHTFYTLCSHTGIAWTACALALRRLENQNRNGRSEQRERGSHAHLCVAAVHEDRAVEEWCPDCAALDESGTGPGAGGGDGGGGARWGDVFGL